MTGSEVSRATRQELHWPRARLGAAVPATIKATPGDFVVRETLSFSPSGAGEHLFVHMEKNALATPELARLLADAHGLELVDVGYAGMKDKRSVASQWFSLRGAVALDETIAELEQVSILEVTRHTSKLRRGQIASNQFKIVLRDLGAGEFEEGLEALSLDGAPNYFGAQRFGWDNVDQATAWLAVRRRRRISKFKQGLYLSVLRSFLFNEVLAARVAAGNWDRAIEGDQLCAGKPAGPLWGRGRSAVTGYAAEIQAAVLEPHREILEGLEHAGLKQGYRSFLLEVMDLQWQRSGADLELAFSLGSGAYATSLLAELFELRPVVS